MRVQSPRVPEPLDSPSLATPASESWGARQMRSVALHWPPLAHIAVLVGRYGAWFGPPLIVAATLIVMARVHYSAQGFGQGPGVAGFAEINRVSAKQLGIQNIEIGNDTGYDGQFYYFVAYRPSIIVTCPHDPTTCPTYQPEFRWQRILYPMTARVLALGHAHLLPYTLLLVNFLAILLTVVLVGQMCVDAGASRWLGAAAGLFAGEVLGFLRDLADPFSVMWVVLAVLLLRRRHYLWASLAVAAALLTRESLIFEVPLLALPVLAQRRWGLLAGCAALALGPFLAWQLVLKVLYGPWALIQGDSQAAQLVAVPFAGLWSHRATLHDFTLILMFVVVPMLLACAIALAVIWRHGPRVLLDDPVPLFVLVSCLLLSLTYWFNWADYWAPTRLSAPAIVLAVVLAAQIRLRSLRGAYAGILSVSAFSPLLVLLGR